MIVRVGSFVYHPYQQYDRLGFNAPLHGLSGNILTSILQSMQLNYTLLEPNVKSFGVRLSNGSFTGLSGMIEHDLIDIGIAPSYPMIEQMSQSFWSFSTHEVTLTLLNGRLITHDTNIFTMLEAFGWQIWALLAIAAMICISAMLFEYRRSSNLYYNLVIPSTSQTRRYIWLLFQTSVMQSSRMVLPSSLKFRFTFGAWLLGMLVMTNVISSKIKVALLVKHELPRINSVDDLAKHQNIAPIGMGGSAVTHMLQHSSKWSYREVWKTMRRFNSDVKHANLLLTDENLLKVLKGEAIIIASTPAHALKTKQKCTTMSRGEYYLSQTPFLRYLATFEINRRTGLEFRNKVDERLRWLWETGLIAKWYREINGNWKSCSVSSTHTGLTFDDISSIFFLFLFLLGCSVLVFLIELCYFRFRR